jgi:hypothetical protein
MLSDPHTLSADVLDIPVHGSWETSDLGDRLRDLAKQLLKPLAQHQSPVPRVLYHYTSRPGLIGILKSGSLWASDIAYMNDASEKQHGLSMLQNILANEFTAAPKVHTELFRRSALAEGPLDASATEYIVCFCADGDLLSQWRSYGSDGGCALGFHTPQLASYKLRRILYDKVKQADLVRSILVETTKLLDTVMAERNLTDATQLLPTISSFLRSILETALLAFKHDAFREEQEWRLIVPMKRDLHIGAIEFRQSHDRIVPYLPLVPNTDKTAGPPLPLISLTCGPSTNRDLMRKSAHLMIERYGYEHVEVQVSDAPLRA